MRWKVGGRCDVRQILFLPLGIFDSYVSLIQNKLFFGTLRRISNLTNLAVTSWAFSWFLSPGLWTMPIPSIQSHGAERWFGASRSGRSNVHIRHDLSVRRRRRWPHILTRPLCRHLRQRRGRRDPATRSLPPHSSAVVVRMTNIRPRGRLERLRRVGETSSSSPSPSPSSSPGGA